MRSKIRALGVKLLPKNLYSRLTLITTVTLIAGYFVVYAVYTTIDSAEVAPSTTITSTLMGKIKTNFDDLSTRVTTLEGSIAGASVWSKVGSDINYTAGKVGIGTVTPAASLDVKRTATDTQFAGWIEGSDTANYGLGVNIANTTSAKAIADFKSGNTSRLFVRADGNVGIGTVNPYAKIHSLGQTFMMGSTTDLVWGSVGTVFQGEFGAASGNTYTKLESFIGGGSAYGDLALNPGGGSVVIGPYEAGSSKLKVVQLMDNSWIALMKNTSPTVGQNFGLTIRAGTNSADSSFSIMDKTSTNFHLYVRGDGNIGIGTGTPATKLHIIGAGEMVRIENTNTAVNSIAQIAILASGAGNYIWSNNNNSPGYYGGSSSLNIYTGQASPIVFFTNGTPRMTIDGAVNGYVGIGVTAPTYRLQLPNTASVAGWGQANAWAIYSDGRVKTDKKDITYGISEIMKINPKQYFHHSSEFESGSLVVKSEGKHTIGFIAQDLQKVIPEAVNKPKDDSKELWSVDYNKLVPVLVNAVKEQQREIEELKSKIGRLENR